MLLVISWILIIAVVLPFVRDDYWIFRIFEYPRYQKFLLLLPFFGAMLWFGNYRNWFHLSTTILLALSIIYLAYRIWPYWPFAEKEMKDIVSTNRANQLKVICANVLQENREFDRLYQQLKEHEPDIIFLLETDLKWQEAMDKKLDKEYPFALKMPLDNTYGLIFYSKIPLEGGKINYLVDPDVPSVETIARLPSGQRVKIWGLHPKPPVPGEDDRSTAKDKELMKVALMAEKERLPVMVMGDLNDVAWSYVTELFRKTSGLLDPRRGRGFYSTFSAKSWFISFPLDYIFCSADFGLISMERLPKNGSDHFAIVSHFEYKPVLKNIQEEPQADPSEKKEAVEKAAKPE
ncbi:endonuclease/exonuclease/phosphatase family protein [Flavihumibacter sediminis]|nr:endonuclease/exonuclease/phosphatase family protein [Flavihumibacter sediminis]